MASTAQTPKQKGDTLETSLEMIERSILGEDITLADRTILITPKKIFRADGVKHEIDLWVEIGGKAGYDSLFIFECKNWRRKVGKNEIIVFNEKVRASSAQRGFFVAKEFTSDAVQQARRFPRIRLNKVREIPADELPSAVSMLHGVRDFNVRSRVNFTKQGPSPTVLTNLDGVCVVHMGREMSADAFVSNTTYSFFSASLQNFNSTELEPGVYPHVFSGRLEFEPNTLFVNGEAMLAVEVNAAADLEITRASLRSSVEVEERGRAYNCEIRMGNDILEVELSQTLKMFKEEMSVVAVT